MDQFSIVAEPKRRKILRLIWDGEMSAGEIAQNFDVTFGAISQHLSILRDAGMVEVRRDGNRRYYQADRESLEPFRSILEQMWAVTLDDLANAAEQSDD